MAKKLLIAVLALVLVTAVAFSANNKKTGDVKPIISHKTFSMPRSAALDGIMADPVIWEDDFEGGQAHWIPDASWNHGELATGRTYQPETSWRYVDTEGHSPSHSWGVTTDMDQELDFLVSPVISIPTELVDDQGNTMPCKGLKINYWLKGNVTDDVWHHVLGPADVVWGYDTTNPGDGASSWFCDLHALSSENQWRQWLITPEIDLTDSDGNLTFMHAYNTEGEFDYLAVHISEDDFMTYTTLGYWGHEGTGEDGGEEGWGTVSIDISAWTAKTVKVRWSSAGDYGTAEDGWWVDAINIGGVFADDGGDTEATEMTASGFTAGDIANGYFGGDYTIGGEVDWIEFAAGFGAPLEVAGWGTNFGAGSDIRFAWDWISTGTTTGQAVYFDDFQILGIGKQPTDLAMIGANLLSASLCKEFTPSVHFMNVGLNACVGNLTWTADILDEAGNSVVTVFGMGNIDVAPDSAFSIAVMGKPWIPQVPGWYTFKASLVFAGDGDPSNNELALEFLVPGGAWSAPVWKEDFDSEPGETLADYGFTVENGGGDAAGNNINTWDYRPVEWGLGFGSAPDISAFWGVLDPGANTTDSSEVLDEGLVTPPIDISMVGKNNTLNLRAFFYQRSGYPGYDDFGVGTSIITLEASVDAGETWAPFFEFVDDDSLPGGKRLPHNRYDDVTVGMWTFLDFDMSEIVWNRHPGNDQLMIRFHLFSENSYYVAWVVDELMVYMGVAAPKILQVADVPDDNGLKVQVAWKPCMIDLKIWDYDQGTGYPITSYCVWREMQVGPSAANVKKVANQKEMLAAVADASEGDIFVTGDGMGWNFLKRVPAMEWKVYSIIAATLWDEVETAFMVSAHTSNPQIFQESQPLAGTSTDDLAPYAPGNVAATAVAKDVTVNWDASYSEDVQYYTVSCNGDEVGTSTALTLADNDKLDGEYSYTVTATDYAGNESVPSAAASVTISTSVDDFNNAVPVEFGLYQNYPNPFNPETSIRYSVAAATHVTVKVYNAAGQEIATLVDKQMAAGNYTANWAARSMSSGVYFYSMKAGNFSQTMKMILMK